MSYEFHILLCACMFVLFVAMGKLSPLLRVSLVFLAVNQSSFVFFPPPLNPAVIMFSPNGEE